MSEPSIFIGSLPGEDEVKLLVDGQTVAVFLPEVIAHPKTQRALEHPWSSADRLLKALVNGRGGWTFAEEPVCTNTNGLSYWLTPKSSNTENPVRLTMSVKKPR